MGVEFFFIGREEVRVAVFFGVHGVSFFGGIAFIMLWVLDPNRRLVNGTRKAGFMEKWQEEKCFSSVLAVISRSQRGGSSMSSNDGFKGTKRISIMHFAF